MEKKSTYKGFTPARKKANEKYEATTYGIRVRVKSEEDRERIQAAASATGESVNGYILEAVRRRMESEKKT